MFASPDTPGMPAPSTKTAWGFLPEGWSVVRLDASCLVASLYIERLRESPRRFAPFRRVLDREGRPPARDCPKQFAPRTQLEFARLGIVTPPTKGVACLRKQRQRWARPRPGKAMRELRSRRAIGRLSCKSTPIRVLSEFVWRRASESERGTQVVGATLTLRSPGKPTRDDHKAQIRITPPRRWPKLPTSLGPIEPPCRASPPEIGPESRAGERGVHELKSRSLARYRHNAQLLLGFAGAGGGVV